MGDTSACSRCQSTKLFAFEADPQAKAAPSSLPVVCRDCGLITINGTPAAFPSAFEEQAKNMAEQAAQAGRVTAGELEKDPNPQIATYFAKVYRSGYLDGFWRALMYWRHNAKEGRLVRLRDLWQRRLVHLPDLLTAYAKGGQVVLEMDKTVYAEFCRLLELGDVPRAENQRPSVPRGDAPLQE